MPRDYGPLPEDAPIGSRFGDFEVPFGDVPVPDTPYVEPRRPDAVARAIGPHLTQGLGNLAALSRFSDAADVGDYQRGISDALMAAIYEGRFDASALAEGVGGGLGMLAGSSEAYTPVLKAIFAGALARTADKLKLGKAKDMASRGSSREDIWNETGWFQGADGEWRFEIDDLFTGLTGRAETARRVGGGAEGRMREVLNHPELYDAYPDIGEMRATVRMDAPRDPLSQGGRAGGVFNPDEDSIDVVGTSPSTVKRRLLHELQHAVQEREGFAVGGNPGVAGMDDYRRSAGEVEARAVEAREELVRKTRRARPPWLDYDTPEVDQIVRRSARD